MTPKDSSFSRRRFIETSALTLGLMGVSTVARAETAGPTAGQVDVQQYGCKGDGHTDDTAALQAALEAARGNGTICHLPAGNYRLNGSLIVPPGVTLCGVSGGVPHSEHPIGTVLLAFGGQGQAEGEPLITLKPNAVARNLTIHYPEQIPTKIMPYPWSIRADGELCQILDVCLTNPYQAIDLGSKWNELHMVRNVFACPLKIGIYIDQCSDIGRIENVHFNPNIWTRMALKPAFLDGDIPGLYDYLLENLVGFKIGRTDWQYISNSFVILPRIGFHFGDFGHGAGNAVITQSGSDSGQKTFSLGVRVDKTQSHAGAQFVNGQFMSPVEIGSENQGPIKFTNCGFWGEKVSREHVRHQGDSTLMLTACHFTGWDHAGVGAPCIRASGGHLIVNGCEFMDKGKQAIVLEAGLKAATVLGCSFRDPNAVKDQSGADVKIGLNTNA